MAFKGVPETDDLRGSPSIEIIKQLQEESFLVSIRTWDPLIKDFHNKGVTHYKNINEAVTGSNAVILMNNHEALSGLDLHEIAKKLSKGAIIYDFWDRYDPLQTLNNSVKYFAWGHHGVGLDKLA
jgi:UDP-N-acetyl-D-mannosaminuronic acid dehydrogenase